MPSASSRSLKSGFAWFGSATVLTRLFDLLSMLVVLRLISRAELGLASVALSSVSIVEAFAGLGMANAIVQRPRVGSQTLSSVHWLCLISCVALAGLTWLGSGFLAAFYERQELGAMLNVAVLKLPLIGITIVPLQLLVRHRNFQRLGIIQTLATLSEALSKMLLAWLGFGAWALINASLVRALMLILLALTLAPFRPQLRYHWQDCSDYLRFGRKLLGANILRHLNRHLDYFIVGKWLGVEALGLYRVAFELAMAPLEAILHFSKKVAYAVFCRVAQQQQRLGQTFVEVLRYVLILTLPTVLIQSFFAEDLIRWTVGKTWLDAQHTMQLLCVSALLRSLIEIYPSFFDAIGKPEQSILKEALNALLLALSIVSLLAYWPQVQVVGYAWMLSAACLLLFLLQRAQKWLVLNWQHVGRMLVYPLSALATMGVALWGIEALAQRWHGPRLLSVLTAALLSIALYIGVLRYENRRSASIS